MWNIKQFVKSRLLIETLTEEFLTFAFETEFDYQKESDQYSVFAQLSLSGFRCKEIYTLFSSPTTFYE